MTSLTSAPAPVPAQNVETKQKAALHTSPERVELEGLLNPHSGLQLTA